MKTKNYFDSILVILILMVNVHLVFGQIERKVYIHFEHAGKHVLDTDVQEAGGNLVLTLPDTYGSFNVEINGSYIFAINESASSFSQLSLMFPPNATYYLRFSRENTSKGLSKHVKVKLHLPFFLDCLDDEQISIIENEAENIVNKNTKSSETSNARIANAIDFVTSKLKDALCCDKNRGSTQEKCKVTPCTKPNEFIKKLNVNNAGFNSWLKNHPTLVCKTKTLLESRSGDPKLNLSFARFTLMKLYNNESIGTSFSDILQKSGLRKEFDRLPTSSVANFYAKLENVYNKQYDFAIGTSIVTLEGSSLAGVLSSIWGSITSVYQTIINLESGFQSVWCNLENMTSEEWLMCGNIVLAWCTENWMELVPGFSNVSDFESGIEFIQKGRYVIGGGMIALAILDLIPARTVEKVVVKLIESIAKVFKVVFTIIRKFINYVERLIEKGYKYVFKGADDLYLKKGNRSILCKLLGGCFIEDTPVLMARSSSGYGMKNSIKAMAFAASMPFVSIPIQDVQLLDYTIAHQTINKGSGVLASASTSISASADDTYMGLFGQSAEEESLRKDPYTSDEQRMRDKYHVNSSDWNEVVLKEVDGENLCKFAMHGDWIAQNGYHQGAVISLNLPEQGIIGMYRVTNIKHILPPPKPIDEAPDDGYTFRPVTGIFIHPAAEVIQIDFADGSTLGVTPLHPIYSCTHDGWQMAGDLRVGDEVLTYSGSTTVLRTRNIPQAKTVYNLEVKDLHNFLVGNGVVVHNSGLCSWLKSRFEKFSQWHKLHPDDWLDDSKVDNMVQQMLNKDSYIYKDPIYTTTINGKTYLIDGHHRLKAAKRVKAEYGINIELQHIDVNPANIKDTGSPYKTVADLLNNSYLPNE